MKEGLDASASLFTADGETLAQACAIPIHLATLIPALAERCSRSIRSTAMRDGDVYILNDPYRGGTHLPDIADHDAGVHRRPRDRASAATMTHHQDVGGMAPGSLPTNATEIYQEGLRIPPLKLRDARRMSTTTLVEILRHNVRIPDTLMGDLNAQLAACTVGARRLRELADELRRATSWRRSSRSCSTAPRR